MPCCWSQATLQLETAKTVGGTGGGPEAEVLPPRENLEYALQFLPNKVPANDLERIDYESTGTFSVFYKNGEQQVGSHT